MAQRPGSGGVQPAEMQHGDVCPFLGTFDDRSTACHYPAPRNACYKLDPALAVPLSKQGAYCLNGGHRGCAVYRERLRRADVRRRWGAADARPALATGGYALGRTWQRLRREPWSARTVLTAVSVAMLIPVVLLVLQLITGSRSSGQEAVFRFADRGAVVTVAAGPTGTVPAALPAARAEATATLRRERAIVVAAPTVLEQEPAAAGADERAGTPTPESVPTVVPTPPDGATIFHVVQANQSLRQLAQMYQTTPADILTRNGFGSAAEIQPGDEIAIPATVAALTATPAAAEQALIRHVVQPGEYLSQLVTRYDTSLDAVLALNPYGDGVGLHPGRVLFIPAPTVSGS